MIPTAEKYIIDKTSIMTMAGNKQKVAEAMIEFAKLHVEAALKAASENAYHDVHIDWEREDDYSAGFNGLKGDIDKDSILEAYPLENIR